MIWPWCLSLLGQKFTCKMKEQRTVYREHVKPICHPLKVDLFQCYYVHYASCGSVHRTMIGLHFFTFWGFFIRLLFSKSVCVSDSCSMRKAYFFRLIKDSGMHLSLWLIYRHRNNIMNVPHFTTKYCFFFIYWWRESGHYKILEWCFGRFFFGYRIRTEEEKKQPLQQGKKKRTEPDHACISTKQKKTWNEWNSIFDLPETLCDRSRYCFSTACSQHAVPRTQLPSPAVHLSCLLGDIDNEVIFTGLPL